MKTMISVWMLGLLAVMSTAYADGVFGEGPWAGSDTGTTLADVAVAPNGDSRAVLSYINVTSDKAASVIQLYTAGAVQRPAAGAASGQADVDVADGTVFSGTPVVVLVDVSTGTAYRAVVSSVADDTVTLTANLPFTMTTDDGIYVMTAGASIPVGAATKELLAAPGALYVGGRGKPLLIDVDGTSACAINAASGIYYR